MALSLINTCFNIIIGFRGVLTLEKIFDTFYPLLVFV